MSSPAPGGFLQHQAFSPTPSATASSSSAYALPHPRARPLKAGGPKESAFIRYVDDSILHIQRQFAKRDNEAALGPEDRGYASFGEAAKDIERLLDIIWVSGTRRFYSSRSSKGRVMLDADRMHQRVCKYLTYCRSRFSPRPSFLAFLLRQRPCSVY